MTKATGDWRSRAACLSADPELFFPLTSAGPSVRQIAQAKTVCRRCPVRAECLDFALATRQPHGVWGGTSELDRSRMRAAAARAARSRRGVEAGGDGARRTGGGMTALTSQAQATKRG